MKNEVLRPGLQEQARAVHKLGLGADKIDARIIYMLWGRR